MKCFRRHDMNYEFYTTGRSLHRPAVITKAAADGFCVQSHKHAAVSSGLELKKQHFCPLPMIHYSLYCFNLSVMQFTFCSTFQFVKVTFLRLIQISFLEDYGVCFSLKNPSGYEQSRWGVSDFNCFWDWFCRPIFAKPSCFEMCWTLHVKFSFLLFF